MPVTGVPDKRFPFSPYGQPASDIWTDPFYSSRPAYVKPGPPGSTGYTLAPVNGAGGGGASGGGGDFGPATPATGAGAGAGATGMGALGDILKALGIALPGLGMLAAGSGNNSNTNSSSLDAIIPELKDALALQLNRDKRQEPLHTALTQLAMNFLPRSAVAPVAGRPDISKEPPYVPSGGNPTPRPPTSDQPAYQGPRRLEFDFGRYYDRRR